MVLYDSRVLNVVRELRTPQQRHIRFVLGYNLQGKTVSMCSSIDQKNRAMKNQDSDCASNQKHFVKELMGELDKLPAHDARITVVEGTTKEILKSVKDLVGEISGLAKSVAVMCTKHDNSKEQVEKLEKSQTEMGNALRLEIKETNEKMTIIGTDVTTLRTRQGGILSVASKIVPWAISLSSLLLVAYVKISK